MNIRIVNPPAGEAPEKVRAAWVGLVLPVAGPQRVVAARTAGVLSGPRSFLGKVFHVLLGRTKVARGYRVKSAVAIDRLSKVAPEAADWWRQNTPHLLKPTAVFIFQEEACAVECIDMRTANPGVIPQKTPLERITERVNRNGDINDAATPRPLLTLEEFFDGNKASVSICCNCSPVPEPAGVYAVLKKIRERPGVNDVRVQVTMFDDPDWPFSDTVWVITSAAADEIKSWFDESMAPDETWTGWTEGAMFEPLQVAARMHPLACR